MEPFRCVAHVLVYSGTLLIPFSTFRGPLIGFQRRTFDSDISQEDVAFRGVERFRPFTPLSEVLFSDVWSLFFSNQSVSSPEHFEVRSDYLFGLPSPPNASHGIPRTGAVL